MLRLKPALHRLLVKSAQARVPPVSLNHEIAARLHHTYDMADAAHRIEAQHNKIEKSNSILWDFVMSDPALVAAFVQFTSQLKEKEQES